MNSVHAFAENLASLLRTGTPLNQALALIGKHHPDPEYRDSILQVHADVEQGHSLSDALSNQRDLFNDFFVSMVRSGEASAQLPNALRQLAEQLQREQILSQKIKSALVYPAILVTGMFLSLFVIFSVVVPRFSSLLEQHGGDVPAATQAMIWLSRFTQILGPWILGLAVIFGFWLFKFSNRRSVKRWSLVLAYKFSRIRRLLNQLDFARFCHGLSNLLASGLPQSEALRLASKSLAIPLNQDQVRQMITRIESGETFGNCVTDLEGLNTLYAHSLANAETANELPVALTEYGQRLEDDFNNSALRLAQLIEPALIIVLGVVIGLVVYTLFSSLQGIGDSVL